MKPVIVIVSAIVILGVTIWGGAQLAQHLSQKTGREEGRQITVGKKQYKTMRQELANRKLAEAEERRDQVRIDNMQRGSTLRRADIPKIKEKEDDSFQKNTTFKVSMSKFNTWLILGLIVIVGWIVWMRFKGRS